MKKGESLVKISFNILATETYYENISSRFSSNLQANVFASKLVENHEYIFSMHGNQVQSSIMQHCVILLKCVTFSKWTLYFVFVVQLFVMVMLMIL